MNANVKVLRIVVVCLLCARLSFAWHDPAHARITRAALLSLPLDMRQFWGAETDNLITRYCLYPDEYHNATAERQAVLRPYCEVNGRPIHNVTWKRDQDIQSIEYLLENLVDRIPLRDVAGAAQYAGTLAHMFEDSTCPAHALTPPDSPLNVMRDLLPPPPGKQDIRLHTVIEHSTPEFDLGSRAPVIAGASIDEAAANLLDRIYRIIKSNRADLIELVRATYAGDEQTMDKFRRTASVAGAGLLADAYYSAFVFAGYRAEHKAAAPRRMRVGQIDCVLTQRTASFSAGRLQAPGNLHRFRSTLVFLGDPCMQEFQAGDRLKVRLPLTAVRPRPDARYENGPYAKIPQQSVLTLTDNRPLPSMIEVIDEHGAQFAIFVADLSPQNVQRAGS